MVKEGSIGDMIDNIVEVVLNTHYNYITDEDTRLDLMQEGYLKAYELLKTGTYDPRRNLRNYLYTGVRNAMQNYLYHDRKEDHQDLEDVEMFIEGESVTEVRVNMKTVAKICEKYDSYGDYRPVALKYLKEINLYEGIIPRFKGKVDSVVASALKCEILWSLVR